VAAKWSAYSRRASWPLLFKLSEEQWTGRFRHGEHPFWSEDVVNASSRAQPILGMGLASRE
jgi:hypothetical protein